ncbi:tRNA (guanosine(37)-N1)-methyltransferase TrmD [Candidatus Bandiella euplotis]|uniref:tRNA (guanine-N(1)-)-methyltransferase n=1 Tax=Candidatus Bandiella euplotis TaxID=1664265 RepID=A0ABZ0UL09_9RICK|nr:tRNA (guanosine(37)-N1)-methyltransferase TrmD [Candidatus Bandiella woodruffii]WPX96819.1 tRNA (guanine-N(1)-)-methyltransferase [Candidatus Bandiella woodruffii]
MWHVNILTLFPEIYPGPLKCSIPGKALEVGLWDISTKNIRDFASNKHKTVDSPPYGGGGGMVLRADVLGEAIEKFFLPNSFPIVYLSPRGKLFNQKMAKFFIQSAEGINILCGRFEGVDERVINEYKVMEVSVGDYVLSSGDIASFAFIDCCLRLLPGVLGNENSLKEESFGDGCYESLLEYPHYTKPVVWRSNKVPEVLTSGNHNKIKEWRINKAEEKTRDIRPDLWNKYLKGVKNEPS